MQLLALAYNNKFNRIVRKLGTINEYISASGNYYNDFNNKDFNFNENDGVNTQHLINWDRLDYKPDYLIVYDTYGINSRWFIVDMIRTRGGQYNLILSRDVVADYYEKIIDSPCFIEKATLPNSNPLIFNSEGMSFNQIKTSEILLKDETQTAWVVGYIPRDSFDGEENSKITINYNIQKANYTLDSLEDYTYYDFNGKYYINYDATQYYKISSQYTLKINLRGEVGGVSDDRLYISRLQNYIDNNPSNVLKDYVLSQDDYFGINYRNILYLENGKIIKVGNAFYKININYDSSTFVETQNVSLDSNVALYLNGIDPAIAIRLSIYGSKCIISYEPIAQDTLSLFMPKPTQRAHLTSQAYDIFCMPISFANFYSKVSSGTSIVGAHRTILTKEFAQNIGISICTSSGSGNIYDVQLLPYCPIRQRLDEDTDGKVFVDSGTYSVTNSIFNNIFQSTLETPIFYNANNINNISIFREVTPQTSTGNNIAGFIYWLTEDSITFNIPLSIDVDDVKISNECDMYRLCSPNWNGQFEFNMAKNGGLDYINVDMTCKPFSPYIHLNPNFKILYGQDFNDARGLICAGNFSLPLVSDKWADYQLLNKNYENQFNRQIENMDVNHKYDMINQVVGSIGSSIATGTGVGMATGNIGAGIAGGVISAVGGAIDIGIAESRFKEQKSYTTDMYNYNLGNIQAMPQSLTKVDSLNDNNKQWPVLEYYTCTDEEKEALRLKLQYNGMTVMRVGTIREFLKQELSYIQGQLIRIEDVCENSHILNVIYDEIKKGVFI